MNNKTMIKNIKHLLNQDLQHYIHDEWITEDEVYLSFQCLPFRFSEYQQNKKDDTIENVRSEYELKINQKLNDLIEQSKTKTQKVVIK